MKKLLVKKEAVCVYHFVKGKRVAGPHPDLRGNVSGLSGDVTGLHGNVDDCCISDEEREAGVRVSALVIGQ